MVLRDHPRLERREQNRCRDAGQETADKQHVEVAPVLDNARNTVNYAKEQANILATTVKSPTPKNHECKGRKKYK